jgi:hypothetical protein
MLQRFSFSFAVGIVLVGLSLAGCKSKPGDSCSNAGEAKCVDGQSALLCFDTAGTKKWTRNDCRGPKGCKEIGSNVDCDETLAQDKDFCDQEGNIACSVDKKTQLKCEKMVWKVETKCNGPKGCVVEGKTVDCDEK